MVFLFLTLILAQAEALAQVWRCEDGSFTNIKPAAHRNCALLAASSVCGEGRNRFIAKGQTSNTEHSCLSEDSGSPLVDMKYAEALKAEADSKGSPKRSGSQADSAGSAKSSGSSFLDTLDRWLN